MCVSETMLLCEGGEEEGKEKGEEKGEGEEEGEGETLLRNMYIHIMFNEQSVQFIQHAQHVYTSSCFGMRCLNAISTFSSWV